MTSQRFDLVDVGSDDTHELRIAAELVREYQRWLGVDLCFQDFEGEMARFPGECVAPNGCVLLVRDREANSDSAFVGVGCVRPLPDPDTKVAELKRVYLREHTRGHGLGRRLTVELLDFARETGYARVQLDTLAHLHAARALYRSLGFVDTAPYYDNPLPGVTYMALAF